MTLTATASSAPIGPPYTAPSAIDGSTISYWLGNAATGGAPQWLQIQSSAQIAVTDYSMKCHPSSQIYSPVNFKFQACDDGVSWVDLDTRTSVAWPTNTAQSFSASNSTAYYYYRVYVTAVNGATDYTCISELTFTTATPALSSGVGNKAGIGAIPVVAGGVGNGAGVSSKPHVAGGVGNSAGVSSAPHVAGGIGDGGGGGVSSSPVVDSGIGNSAGWAGILGEPAVDSGVGNGAGIGASPVVETGVGNSAGIASLRAALDAGIGNGAGIGAAPHVSGGVGNSAGWYSTDADSILGETFTVSLTAKASLTASLTSITLTPIALGLTARASLTLGTMLAVETWAFDLTAKARLNVTLPRPHTIDPVTGLPQYRLRAVLADGTGLGELPNAEIGELVEELGLEGTRLDFALPKYDATNALVSPERGKAITEVQVWRGPNLETWQKVDGARQGDTQTDYDCSGLAGYLSGRIVGKFPKTDLLVNGDFSRAEYGWSFGYDTDSIPPSPPTHQIVNVDFFGAKAKALQLGGADKITTVKTTLETAAVFVPNSATFLSGGAALITAKANDIPAGTTAILIEGHTAYNWLDGDYGDGLALSAARALAAKPLVEAVHPTATVTTVGKGRFEPLNDNSTYAEQAVNRRVEFHYTTTVTADADSSQYAQGTLTTGTITVPKASKRPLPVTFRGWANLTGFLSESKNGYGVYIRLVKDSAPNVTIEEANSTLDENTPDDDWDRHTATVTVPADGITYRILVRLYAPGGVVLWAKAGLYPAEALHFPKGTDQALIVKGLVEHGQSAAVGKLGDEPILIGTRTPLTGVTRTKTYPYHERRQILDAVSEIGALFDGVDLSLEHTPTVRRIASHFPRKGGDTGVTSSGTRWVAQALESSGADREEGYVTDMSGLGGVLMERLVYSEPETPVTELDAAARSSLARYGHPVTDLTVTIGQVGPPDPALTSFMLDRVTVGDVVNVDIQDGTTVITGKHRVVRKSLTPETDTLRYSLIPEV